MRLSILASFLALGATLVSSSPSRQKPVPSGFVTTNGKEFELDGKPFAFVGANSYWLPLLLTEEDVETTFKSLNSAGVKVLRTWGFNAINGSELAGALESGLTYYQLWNSSEWELNEGPQGLQRLDKVIAAAEAHDIKIILTFTNNWFGYGGLELYINWILGAGNTHDVFYTDSAIIASYQRYVKTIVERYKDSPAIFSWQLVNEARCAGDLLPSGPNCVPGSGTLNTWYGQQSDFVRSLDPYHLISTGGEGQFNWKDPEEYWYDGELVSDFNFNGGAGEDFDADLYLPNIDYGSYHLYPQSWYPELDYPGSNFSVEDWGLGWIEDHANSADAAGKPVLIEEFGLTGLDNKTDIYPSWVQKALDTKHAGVIPWQFGVLDLTEDGGFRTIKYTDQIFRGASPNDGNTFYPNQTAVWDIFTNAAVVQKERSG